MNRNDIKRNNHSSTDIAKILLRTPKFININRTKLGAFKNKAVAKLAVAMIVLTVVAVPLLILVAYLFK